MRLAARSTEASVVTSRSGWPENNGSHELLAVFDGGRAMTPFLSARKSARRTVLAELHPEYRELLDERFAYTYLIFDMDPQESWMNQHIVYFVHNMHAFLQYIVSPVVWESCRKVSYAQKGMYCM